MTFIKVPENFTCGHCGFQVTGNGYTNHCPRCLWSKHVDRDGPGDRLSSCGGLMQPVGLDQRGGKGWLVLHACTTCDKRIPNKAAPDDDLAGFQSPDLGSMS
jgi:hypothetical protein